MIKLKNVAKSYSEGDTKHFVLNGLDLEINKGEIVVLLGKSGSGKSTLLNLLSGIDIPDTGTICFDDTDLNRLNESERTLFRRKNIGFIFQFFNLIPTLTVEENLLLPLELNKKDIKSGTAVKLLEDVGLVHKKDTYPDKLSGGEQQRIAIARALIHEPDFILADEPTGNLDYETSLQVVDLIDKLVKQKGKTMIMATHSPEVMGLADRIYSLKDGRITEIQSDTHTN
jgi:putative ABC transport system ATP-binding protein